MCLWSNTPLPVSSAATGSRSKSQNNRFWCQPKVHHPMHLQTNLCRQTEWSPGQVGVFSLVSNPHRHKDMNALFCLSYVNLCFCQLLKSPHKDQSLTEFYHLTCLLVWSPYTHVTPHLTAWIWILRHVKLTKWQLPWKCSATQQIPLFPATSTNNKLSDKGTLMTEVISILMFKKEHKRFSTWRL